MGHNKKGQAMEPVFGVIKHYDWGSTGGIPDILGTEEDGNPQAEYWLGAHPGGPAQMGNKTLLEVIKEHPDVVGAHNVSTYGPQLPFLMKILSASQPLSLQAHPTSEQAIAGFAEEEKLGLDIDDPTRTYKDTWHKPEILVALTEFDALVGFRPPLESLALFTALGLPSADVEAMLGPLRHREGCSGLAQVFLATLTMDDSRRHFLDEVVSAAVKHVTEQSDFGEFCRTAVLLDDYHPGDPSILAALLMNRVRLAPGECLQIRPGTLHAYLFGTGVEVMANSDNVLRGGLTRKHIDVDALVDVVDFTPEPPNLVQTATTASPGILRYDEQVSEFSLWRLDLFLGREVELPASDCGRILLVIDGHVDCRVDGRSLELVQGQSAFFPAGETVRLEGDCLAFLTAAGETQF